jgi:catechol 2,3-dioxygenase-like lactoylglutathione lyase family enzyme
MRRCLVAGAFGSSPLRIQTFDHIDFRVRDLAAVTRFYDALMTALGLGVVRGGRCSREYYQKDRSLPFFGLNQSVTSVPGRSRIAFAAPSRAEVKRIAAAVRAAGGKAVEGPSVCASYHQPYYAVFFEDPEGNKFEVCCRK